VDAWHHDGMAQGQVISAMPADYEGCLSALAFIGYIVAGHSADTAGMAALVTWCGAWPCGCSNQRSVPCSFVACWCSCLLVQQSAEGSMRCDIVLAVEQFIAHMQHLMLLPSFAINCRPHVRLVWHGHVLCLIRCVPNDIFSRA
jgi:hypothetical protein